MYFEKSGKDSVLLDIVQFAAPLPEFSKEPKGAPTLRNYFKERLSFYKLEFFYPSPDSLYYFLLSEKTASTQGERTGIGGYYRIKGNKLYDFTEVFHTPKMKPEILEEKGRLLFKELVDKGNVDAYLKDKSYIEFPDERVYYDRNIKEWKSR